MPLPGGPPPTCGYTLDEASFPRFQVGAGLGSLQSTLRFENERDVKIDFNSTSLVGTYRVKDVWSVRLGGGVTHKGSLTPRSGGTYKVKQGVVFSAGVDHVYKQGTGWQPDLTLTLSLGVSNIQIEDASAETTTEYTSADLRLGSQLSWSYRDRFYAYVAVRVFGGPVWWVLDGDRVLGSDIHHYQGGAGAAFPAGPAMLFVELSPLGEKSLSMGGSFSW